MKLGFGLSLVGQRAAGGAAAFTPADIFTAGGVGVWHEASLTTAFASTTDLTPCSVGDTCGFFLDKSEGAGYSGSAFTGLGANEYTEPNALGSDVDSAAGITATGGAAISSQSSETNGSAFAILAEANTTPAANSGVSIDLTSLGLTSGATYEISIDYRHVGTGNRWSLGLGSSPTSISGAAIDAAVNTGDTAWVTGSAIFVAGEADAAYLIAREVSGDNDGGVYLDNLLIREIPGNHSIEDTASARPTLRQTGGGVYYLEDDEVDDALSWTAPADTDYTVSYVDSAGNVTTLTGQSLSGATNILLDPALVGYLAIDRALTAGEQSDLDAYWGTLT